MSPDLNPAIKRERDIRLDFFRGMAMIVILFAHITDNPWNLWMPGRFGFSDATEVFVFCSGIASALAYGAIFAKAGWWVGAGRILYRIWQVYWVHIGIFMVTLLCMLGLNLSGVFPQDEVRALNLMPFLLNTGPNFFGLMTLTYVPNYFDILPMYMVLLALVPPMLLLARINGKLALLASVSLWAVGTTGGLKLPAEFWFDASTRSWFFNPFAWQLVFFTGFGLAAGWLPVPPIRRDLAALAAGIVIATIPFAYYRIINAYEPLQDWRAIWWPMFDKTRFGVLRYVHFLSLAYLAYAAAGEGGARLKTLVGGWPRICGVIVDIGRQSLAVFAVSMVLARVLGAVMKLLGTGVVVTPVINLTALLLIWLVARAAGWFKGQSWKQALRADTAKAEVPTTGPAAPDALGAAAAHGSAQITELARARQARAAGAKA